MDYSKYLVLYSGGVDSTYFIEREKSAKHLIHYSGNNKDLTSLARANANLLERYLVVKELGSIGNTMDGETNKIHALYDAQVLLDAGVHAVSHGMEGIVACFNKDDIGTDFKAIEKIVQLASSNFKILLPLLDVPAKKIRAARKTSKLKAISCMVSAGCGYCSKCKRGY